MCEHDDKASNSLVWSSDPGSTAISFCNARPISYGESSGYDVTGNRPTAVTRALIHSAMGENATAYSISSNDLELGMGDKGTELTMPNDAPTTAGIQRPPTALGLDLTTDSAGVLEAKTRQWSGGSCGGGSPSISAVAVVSGPSEECSASPPVTHTVPAAVHLSPLTLTATTFEAYLAGLE